MGFGPLNGGRPQKHSHRSMIAAIVHERTKEFKLSSCPMDGDTLQPLWESEELEVLRVFPIRDIGQETSDLGALDHAQVIDEPVAELCAIECTLV